MKLLPPTKMKSSGRLFSPDFLGQSFYFLRGQGTLHAGLGEVVDGVARQQGQHTTDVLVIHHAHDNVQAAVGLLPELLRDVADAAHVVSRVADQDGSVL